MNRVLLLLLILCVTVGAVQDSSACATSQVYALGAVSKAASISDPITAPTTYAQLDAAAERTYFVINDSKKQPRTVRIYFLRLDADTWRLYLVMDGGDTLGGVPGVPVIIDEELLHFSNQDLQVQPVQMGGFFPWNGGGRATAVRFTLEFLYLDPSGLAIQYTANGKTTTGECPQTNVRDFDGDGADDAVLWNKNRREWSIRLSKSVPVEFVNRRWGARGDEPHTGDVGGDGLADMIYWRPSQALWFICHSSVGFNCTEPQEYRIPGGRFGDQSALSDYDGDGIVDYGVYRAKEQQILYVSSVLGSVETIPFGARHFAPLGAVQRAR